MIKPMKLTLCLLSILLFTGLAVADEGEAPEASGQRDPQAVTILEKVDSAIKAVTAVRYQGSTTATGAATRFAFDTEGEVAAEGWQHGMPAKFRTHVTTKQPDSEETVELTGGGNGDVFYLIDHSAKKAWADMDPGVMGSSGRAVRGFGMIEFLHDAPFDDELNAESVELLDEQEIGGVACYQIRVVYSGGAGESIWFFAKNDLLPRRRVMKIMDREQNEGTIENTITHLEVNPTLEAKVFDLRLPEGYEQIDDFAP